jgi:hypothetical protein
MECWDLQNGQKIRRIIFGGWGAFVVLVCLWPADHVNMPMSLAMGGGLSGGCLYAAYGRNAFPNHAFALGQHVYPEPCTGAGYLY